MRCLSRLAALRTARRRRLETAFVFGTGMQSRVEGKLRDAVLVAERMRDAGDENALRTIANLNFSQAHQVPGDGSLGAIRFRISLHAFSEFRNTFSLERTINA
mmetsp:Transcript_4971/g.14254  ORF Transcript_4971/g.14254 Transcript_4971/m.14254 type:complete len:103 (+) Transcript_4971:976-1284(+)